MGHVTFSATLAAEMVIERDLFQESWTGSIALVTTHAVAVAWLVQFDIGILRMRLSRTVARFAGNCFVFTFGKFGELIRMTFVAGFTPGETRLVGSNFLQSIPAIPAVLAEGWRSEKGSGYHVRANDEKRKKNQTQDLRW